jgi:SET domain-containing protein
MELNIDGNPLTCLTPYASFLNNSFNNNLNYSYIENEKAFVFESNRYIEIGEELTINYGEKRLLELWYNYGYIHENADMTLTHTLKLTEDSPNFELKKKLLNGETEYFFEFTNSDKKYRFFEMLAF